jgi:hypothetical protein
MQESVIFVVTRVSLYTFHSFQTTAFTSCFVLVLRIFPHSINADIAQCVCKYLTLQKHAA